MEIIKENVDWWILVLNMLFVCNWHFQGHCFLNLWQFPWGWLMFISSPQVLLFIISCVRGSEALLAQPSPAYWEMCLWTCARVGVCGPGLAIIYWIQNNDACWSPSGPPSKPTQQPKVIITNYFAIRLNGNLQITSLFLCRCTSLHLSVFVCVCVLSVLSM